jgi:hypothetical protein
MRSPANLSSLPAFKITRWFLVATLAASLPSLAQARSAAEWTVLVYMNGQEGLDCAALHSFNDLASVRDSRKLHILVELGRTLHPAPCDIGSSIHWTGIRRFRVRPGSVPTHGSTPPASMTEMSSPDTLKEFLKWTRENYQAQHYMLIIWGHGNGPPLLTRTMITPSVRLGAEKCIDAYGFPGSTKGVFTSAGDKGILYNRDIELALQDFASHGQPIDILGFDACLMANIETAYAMKDVARIMIASEALVPDCSWNYGYTLNQLVAARREVDPITLSRFFVKSYGVKYPDNGNTLSAVDLTRVKIAAERISRIAQTLCEETKRNKNAVATARAYSSSFGTDNNLVDLMSFLTAFEKQEGISNRALFDSQQVISSLESAVIIRFPAASTAAYGLTIFFPADSDSYKYDTLDANAYNTHTCDRRDESHAVDFVCDTNWPAFLHDFLPVLDSRLVH